MNQLETDSVVPALRQVEDNLRVNKAEFSQKVMNICSKMSDLHISSAAATTTTTTTTAAATAAATTTTTAAAIAADTTTTTTTTTAAAADDDDAQFKEKCIPCNVVFTSPAAAKQHLEGKKHKKALDTIQVDSQRSSGTTNNPGDSISTNTFKCDVCNVRFTSDSNAKQHLEGRQHKNKMFVPPITSCVTPVTPPGVSLQPECKNNILIPRNASCVTPVTPPGVSLQSEPMLTSQSRCELCDVEYTSESNALDHLNGKPHKRKVEMQAILQQNDELKCNDCNVVFSGTIDYQNHMKGKNHIKASKRKSMSNAQSTASTSVMDYNGEASSKCDVCNIVLTSSIMAKQHYEGWKHQKNLNQRESNSSNNAVNNDLINQTKCDICNVVFTSKANAHDHLQGKSHLRKSYGKPVSSVCDSIDNSADNQKTFETAIRNNLS